MHIYYIIYYVQSHNQTYIDPIYISYFEDLYFNMRKSEYLSIREK